MQVNDDRNRIQLPTGFHHSLAHRTLIFLCGYRNATAGGDAQTSIEAFLCQQITMINPLMYKAQRRITQFSTGSAILGWLGGRLNFDVILLPLTSSASEKGFTGFCTIRFTVHHLLIAGGAGTDQPVECMLAAAQIAAIRDKSDESIADVTDITGVPATYYPVSNRSGRFYGTARTAANHCIPAGGLQYEICLPLVDADRMVVGAIANPAVTLTQASTHCHYGVITLDFWTEGGQQPPKAILLHDPVEASFPDDTVYPTIFTARPTYTEYKIALDWLATQQTP